MKINLIYLIFGLLAITSNCQLNELEDLSTSFEHQQQLQTAIKQQNNFYTAKTGDTLVIPCEIENRKQATVIWQYSKSKIPETLAIGYFYFRKDFRIRVIANSTNEKEQSWNLEIRRVKLEDEGYYLCKVMTETESLKRVVYLRVEVDMTISPLNPTVKIKDGLTIVCNTSFTVNETTKVAKSNHNMNNFRISWYKDGISLSSHEHQIYANRYNNTTSLNYKIDYYSKPRLSSKLRINSFNLANIGVYTCKFRLQNVSTHVTSKNFNKQMLEFDDSNSFLSSTSTAAVAYNKANVNFLICSLTTLVCLLCFNL